MATKRAIRDYRRLKRCPDCGKPIQKMTAQFSNWKQVKERDEERKQMWIGPPPPKIPLKHHSMQAMCDCGFHHYYLADTGERCNRLGRRIKVA